MKRFYTQGEFYGIDEMVHAHTLPDLRESVINVFNLDDKPVEKEVRFRLADIGLPAGSVKIEGAAFTVEGRRDYDEADNSGPGPPVGEDQNIGSDAMKRMLICIIGWCGVALPVFPRLARRPKSSRRSICGR